MAVAAEVVEVVQADSTIEGAEVSGGQSYKRTLYEMGILHSNGEPFVEGKHPPTGDHWMAWMGTMNDGKSVLLWVFHGTKVAFLVGTLGAGLAVLIGMTLGLFAGFLGGWVDELIQYIYSTLASIPYLLLILALAFIFKNGEFKEVYDGWPLSKFISLGLFNIILVIGCTSWVTLCRLIRAEVKKVRELDYIQAARSLGFSNIRILFRHVLPNVFHLVIINFSLTFVTAIKSEVILTFLNVGVDVDGEASWGRMIANAKNELMQGVWWPLLAAGGALFLLALAVNYVGDALRDALDPKLKT
jgi:peptide/nickel transport system permease protein